MISESSNNTNHSLLSEASHLTEIDIVSMFRRRWGWIVVSTVVGLALAAAYFFLAPVIYESTATLLLYQKNANLPAQGAEAQQNVDTSADEKLLATHIQIMTSPRIVKQAMTTRGLGDLPSIQSHLDEKTTYVDYVCENLIVERGGEGGSAEASVLNVALRHSDPGDSALVLSAILESYQEFVAQTIKGVGNEAVELIESAQGELQWDIETSEEKYRNFREDATLTWDAETTRLLNQTKLSQLFAALSELQTRRSNVQSRLNLLETRLESLGNDPSDENLLALISQEDVERLSLLVNIQRPDPISESFQAETPIRQSRTSVEFEQLASLKVHRQSRLMKLGKNHPSVRSVEAQIAELQGIIDAVPQPNKVSEKDGISPEQIVGAYKMALTHDLDELGVRIQDLQNLIETETQNTKEFVALELTEESLREEVDRNRRLYDTVLERLGEINLLTDYGGFITEILKPVTPGAKVWPSLPIVGALGILLGGLVGSGIALYRELADHSFQNPDQVRTTVGQPILAHIPRLDFKAHRRTLRRQRKSKNVDLTVVSYHAPSSRFAECIRGLRTNLTFALRGKSNAIVLITSPNVGDGKTTTLSNLAVSLASLEKRVLLIDCDLRRPRLHKEFLTDNSIGLTQVIEGEETFENVLVETDVPNVWVVPSGKIPENPAELLGSPRFAELLQEVRGHYDYVLLDCPPVLAVSDPIVVASVADHIIFHLRLNTHSRDEAKEAIRLLSSCETPILGATVIHDAARQSGYNGYQSANGYGYGTYGARNSVYYRQTQEV